MPQFNDALLRREEVEARTGIRRSQLYALIKEGKFPAPIALAEGCRSRAWIESEITDWISAQIESGRKARAI